MIVTFFRHATAQDRNLPIPDESRALTGKGEKQVKRVAEFCMNNELTPGAVFSSPIIRALQTAHLLEKCLPTCPKPRAVEWLSTASNASDIISELAKLADQGLEDVWLVGHEPDFSESICSLTGASSGKIEIKKASLTRVEADFFGLPSARLLWSVPCALMR